MDFDENSELVVIDRFSGDSETAGLYNVCQWLIKTYPDDIFVNPEHPVTIMRDKAKEVLEIGGKNNAENTIQQKLEQ